MANTIQYFFTYTSPSQERISPLNCIAFNKYGTLLATVSYKILKPQTMGPKDKASTAFSEICKKNNKKSECSYKFAIQETTRGSNKKVYNYEGKRVKLDKPIVLELKDKKTGKIKKLLKNIRIL